MPRQLPCELGYFRGIRISLVSIDLADRRIRIHAQGDGKKSELLQEQWEHDSEEWCLGPRDAEFPRLPGNILFEIGPVSVEVDGHVAHRPMDHAISVSGTEDPWGISWRFDSPVAQPNKITVTVGGLSGGGATITACRGTDFG